MSELAVSLSGEPFDPPEKTAGMRVKKMKSNGAPELVYARSGLPLVLPVDAGVDDLRREVPAPIEGKYRLEPVDEHNKTIPGAPLGYVHLFAPEHTASLTPPTPPAVPASAGQTEITAQLVGALLTAMKEHTEMARMYVAQFPVLANTFSGIARDPLLAARTPLVVPVMPESKPNDEAKDGDEEDEEQEEEEEEIEEEAAQPVPEPKVNWPQFAMDMVDRVTPHVAPLVMGLSAKFGARGSADAPRSKGAPDAKSDAKPDDATASTSPAPRLDLPTMLHLKAIRDAMAPQEGKLAMLMAEEFTPEQQATWIETLRPMSVPDAVAYVRAQLAEARGELNTRTPAASPAHTPGPARATSAPSPAPAPQPEPRNAPEPRRADAPTEPRRAQTPTDPPTATPHVPAVAPARAARSVRGPVAEAAVPSAGLSLLDDATQAHLAAIQAALLPDEGAALRARFAALSHADRAGWIATLLILSVSESVAVIRTELLPAARVPDEAPRNVAVPRAIAAVPVTNAAPAAESPIAAMPVAAPPVLVSTMPPQAATAPMPVASAAPTPDTSAMPSAVRPDANGSAIMHLNAIESALAPEDRARVHAMVRALSPAEQNAWLRQLLSRSVAEGAELIRGALADADDGQEIDDDGQPGNGASIAPVDVADTSGVPSAPEVSAGPGEHAAQPDNAAPLPPAPPAAPAAVPPALPLLDQPAVALFHAIEGALTLPERLRAHELAAQLPPAELRRWAAELVTLPVSEAVARIRAALATVKTGPNASTSTTKGGVS